MFLYSELFTQKHVLCMHPVKRFLNFGYSAAPTFAAFVLSGSQGSVRSLNRWDYRWLPLSPKFNAKQHTSR